MQVLPPLCTSEAQSKPVQKGLLGWPPPDTMAQTIMTALGEHRACWPQVSSLLKLQCQAPMPAGLHGDTTDGINSPQDLTAATSDDDAIDLLFLHVAWDETCGGKGCSTSELVQLEASTAQLQHTWQAVALPPDVAPVADLSHWQYAGSSAALHHWLDDVLRLLFQHSTFSSSVLAAILLRNQQTDGMHKVRSLAACMLAS